MKKLLCMVVLLIFLIPVPTSAETLDEAYESGYEYGSAAGFEAGFREAKAQQEEEQREMRDNRKGALFTICIAVGIPTVLGFIDKRKYKR